MPPEERVEADGQAMQPFENFRSDLGIAEGALGEFSGPATAVSSPAFLETTNGILKLLFSRLPRSRVTFLSERGWFFRGFFVVFSWFFRGFFMALFCLEKTVFGPFSLLFRGFSWLFRGPRFGQILHVLALEQSSDYLCNALQLIT